MQSENPIDIVRTVPAYSFKTESVLITVIMRTLMVVNWSRPEKEHEKTLPKSRSVK